MRLETIFKASLLSLTLVVLFYLDVALEISYLVVITGMAAYTLYTFMLYRDQMREQQGHVLVIQSYNWVPASLMWTIIAAMVLKDMSGPLFYINGVLLLVIVVLSGLRETTKAFVVSPAGIQELKTKRFLAASEISEILASDGAVTLRTKTQDEWLTFRKEQLQSPGFSEAVALLTNTPKVLKEV